MFGPGRNWRYLKDASNNKHEAMGYWGEFSEYVRHNFKGFLEDTLDDAIEEELGIRVDVSIYIDDNFRFVHPISIYMGSDEPDITSYELLSHVRIRVRTQNREAFAMECASPDEIILYRPRDTVNYISMIVRYVIQHMPVRDYQPYVRGSWATREDAPDFLRFTERYSATPLRENKRAKELLLSHCTNEQAEEYKNYKTITVIGCKTQTVYRLRRRSQINVDVMGDNGSVKYKLCTVPDPENNPLDLPIEDQLLAQKELIELNEQEFLKIAIKW